MFRLTSNIRIGDIELKFCNSIEITSTWNSLTDRALIVFPRKVTFEGQEIMAGENPLFKRGDPVEIQLGYDDVLKTQFRGFISKIRTKIPIEIECEDQMYELKQVNITKSFPKGTTLKQLLAGILPSKYKDADLFDEAEGDQVLYKRTIDTELGAFRIDRATVAQVFERLRRDYSIQSFFRDNVLYVGLAYVPEISKEEVFNFNRNIIDNTLEYNRDDDIRIKVTAISIDTDNNKTEVNVGDPDGDRRTLHYFNLNESDLRAAAERDLEKLKFEGYRGGFQTFGEPSLNHGDTVELVDDRIPDNTGKYLVKSVTKTFGVDGYRQEVSPDRKVSE